ncbi:hypothetical protein DICVIV_10643 [Dictyocaulus viviparus]|uniref:aECM cysteine-cradle domain-containing protein n=1 Tax=Dictyocaulus viviparus TaxID=29172 RepID=A0A0D8XLS9_DICVI|nr:hypothetical protein DICVIV_10643 [Dictyocaulus viviparus]
MYWILSKSPSKLVRDIRFISFSQLTKHDILKKYSDVKCILRSVMDSGLTEMNDEKSENEPLHDETKSVTPFNVSRKVLRLNKLTEVPVSNVMDEEKNIDEEGVHVRSHVRKLRRKSKKTKEMEDESLQTSTLPSVSTTSSDELLRRKHCLNIRTFARQFGIDDIEEFARYQCAFIENYYPHMTCDKRKEYVAECKKYYEVQK